MEAPTLSAQTAASRIDRLLDEAGMPAVAHEAVQSLAIDNLGKRYGETVALNGANVGFRPGVHTILGENGSGKSTLLKLLSGVVTPSEGRIAIDGSQITAGSPADMQKLGLSTVFQEVLIAPHRPVVENVVLGMDLPLTRRIPHQTRDRAVSALLSQLARQPIGLQTLAGDLPLAAQQIVVLTRAFIRRPSVLLLDEATAALDYADRDMVFEAIEDYAAAGNIVIFISHRLEEVQRLSDRVTVLRSGRVIETLNRDQVTGQRLLELMAPEAHIHVA